MKRLFATALLLTLGLTAAAQQYSFTFRLEGSTDTMLYIARHYRDELRILDSAQLKNGSYIFAGRRQWPRGIYALVHQDRTKALGDFTIDGSLKFTIAADSKLSHASAKVTGCTANQQMFAYLATEDEANTQAKEIRERMKDHAKK